MFVFVFVQYVREYLCWANINLKGISPQSSGCLDVFLCLFVSLIRWLKFIYTESHTFYAGWMDGWLAGYKLCNEN